MHQRNQHLSSGAIPADQPVYSDLSDDPDMSELLDAFVGEMPGRAQRIAVLFGTQDWKSLGMEAHRLRGSAGGHGFEQLGVLAGELEALLREHAGREQQLRDGHVGEALRRLVDRLVAMCRRCAVRRAA